MKPGPRQTQAQGLALSLASSLKAIRLDLARAAWGD